MMDGSTRRRIDLLLRVTLVWGVVVGAMFGGASGSALPDAPLRAVGVGMLAGSLQGAMLVGLVFGAEIFLPATRFGHALERAPFFVTLGSKVLVYGALITLVVSAKPGWRLVQVAAPLLFGPDIATPIAARFENPTGAALVRTFVLVGVGVFVIQMSRLIGERTLRDIAFGRYHRSRLEERFFLFVDVTGSTPLAERIGPDAVHRFLGEVFRLASNPIEDQRGDVHQYVGDEIVVTWTVAEGRDHARPVACFFAIEQALMRAAPAFERDFGVVPRLRAALHAGPVITGEVGGSRRAIVYHGDVMNTTSRIEQATRDFERQFLVSGDALERLNDLGSFVLEDIGPKPLRGRTAAMQLYAVTAEPAAAGRVAV